MKENPVRKLISQPNELKEIRVSIAEVNRKLDLLIDNVPLLAHAVNDAEIKLEIRKKQKKLSEAANKLINS